MSRIRRHLGIAASLIALAVALTPAAPLGAAGPLLAPSGGGVPAGTSAMAGTGSAVGANATAPAAGTSGTGISYGSDGRLTVLLVGSDWRLHLGGERTDVLLVVSIDPTTKRVAAASIPRDTVFFPLHGGGTTGSTRVNAIYEIWYRHHGLSHKKVDNAGFGQLTKDVSLALGVEIDYWAMVRFNGFVALVDKISGVNVDNAEPIIDSYYRSHGSHGIYFPAATDYHLKGDPACFPKPRKCHSALAYARSRHGTVGNGYNGDFPRARRAQTLVMAAAASFIAHISSGELSDFVSFTGGRVWTNMPRTVTALGQLWNLAHGAHLATHDTVVFGPRKWAHETPQTPTYTYRLYLNRVRGWIDTHFYPV